MSDILEIKNLSIEFDSANGTVYALRDVSLNLKKGDILAVVGESGCGKSVLCKSVMKLLPKTAHITSGTIMVDGQDITAKSERYMCKARGKMFSMILQDPMTSLNPTLTVGAQIAEAVRINDSSLSKKQVTNRVIELLEMVGIDRAEERMKLYPYNFSGGMRQRIVIAIAVAANPAILFADEPTTALDVTIQSQILDLLMEIRDKLNTSIVLVTHDLGVVAKIADRVAVMYAGKIVEMGTAEDIFYDARHPYTWGLMKSLPAFAKGGEELYTIPGMPPNLTRLPEYDAFADRNQYALNIDYEEEPPMYKVSDTHYAATWLLDERAPKIDSPLKEMINE